MTNKEAIDVLVAIVPEPVKWADESTSTMNDRITEAIGRAIYALDKDEPMEVIQTNKFWKCPNCRKALSFNNKMVRRCECGQSLKPW